ncbi:MAG: glycoside hydrolase family 92 protein, partial [Bacteroidaceae bacterium]|nr:glycoside hydrolase family 92 protein [Bacteroidaceae bacterium]
PRDKAELPLFSTGMIGQYAHGNEPSHHVAYLYNMVGQPHKAQQYIAQIRDELYRDEPAGLCGNDDCGQTSAWLVWSAMGMYPVHPASARYDTGTPMFPRLTLRLPNRRPTTIVAHNFQSGQPLVRAIHLDGRPITDHQLPHSIFTRGGRVEFLMQAAPRR